MHVDTFEALNERKSAYENVGYIDRSEESVGEDGEQDHHAQQQNPDQVIEQGRYIFSQVHFALSFLPQRARYFPSWCSGRPRQTRRRPRPDT